MSGEVGRAAAVDGSTRKTVGAVVNLVVDTRQAVCCDVSFTPLDS